MVLKLKYCLAIYNPPWEGQENPRVSREQIINAIHKLETEYKRKLVKKKSSDFEQTYRFIFRGTAIVYKDNPSIILRSKTEGGLEKIAKELELPYIPFLPIHFLF